MDDESINGIWPLMKEARSVNNSLLQQSLSPDAASTIQLENENPFLEDEHQVATRVGFHYNIWTLQRENKEEGQKEIRICIRCAVHSHNKINRPDSDEKQTMNIYALTEYTPEIMDWRMNLDKGVIPCLNKEITNNSFKISRWLLQSLLAQVDFIKFAFITRKKFDNADKHIIVGTHTINTQSWAKQLNFNMPEMWKKLKYVIDLIQQDPRASDEMEYILLKDAHKQSFRLYRKDSEAEHDEDDDQIEHDEGDDDQEQIKS